MTLKIIFYLYFISLTGVLGKESRITGGKVAIIDEFPYMASIRRHEDLQLLCGATIISKWNVLSSAHCIYPFDQDLDDLRVSTGSISSIRVFGTYRLEQIHYHPAFHISEPIANDIVVVKLRNDIVFSNFQNKIPLASVPPQSDEMALIVGWGVYDRMMGPVIASRLRKAIVRTVGLAECRIRMPFPIKNDHFCTYQSRRIGVTSGDAGGPVVVNGELYGIIAYGSIQEGNNTPDVHMSVYHCMEFILGKMTE